MMEKRTSQAVLVTGGAGFIGSNLVEALLNGGTPVTVLDNFSTGKRENLDSFRKNPDFRLVEGDVRDPACCREALTGCSCVLHEAALGSVPRSIQDPVESISVNVLGFATILKAAVDAGVKRFVYASSSSVYGDSAAPVKREAETGMPLSPYAITKHTDELIAGNFHRLYGIDTIGLRYFNVFGRRQDPAGAYAAVIPKFVTSLLHHRSPVIHGDGSNSRDFTYVDNVVQANLLALRTGKTEALNTVYNVGCGESMTLNTLFELLKKELSAFDSEISGIAAIYDAPRPGDIPHSLAEIGKAAGLLGYQVQFTAPQGLHLATEWYYKHL